MSDGALAGLGVLVTGGGTGIGRACAAALAADGAVVTICGRTEAKLAESQEVIQPGHGGSVGYVVTDVTDEAAVQAAVEAATAAAGNLAGVVANAGGGGGLGPYHVQDTEEFLRVLHLNVLGTMLCVKHAVPHLLADGGGSFVGMSSIAGHVTHPWFGAYPVAKAGIEQMMRNAADEFGRSNVRFNAVRPGFIATEIMNMIPTDSDVYDSYVRNTPMGDVGRPEDVGNLVRFLIGPESRWITGTCINVDGGNALRAGPDYSQFVAPGLGDDVMFGNLPD
ncbi:MAG TPA: SDR family oxidoreductase [Acidimicrobiales bacterium]|jgi:NAD(P)-dependent dehydrogenase (short-subunit alcohol dehydrogenase family)|nr:SDR family oxidoreductase [Actinomycetes bacterium]MDP7351773.1 SDR family oxidoreductase [Acidimicrobiales bacterium]HJL76206.1 SDR family oxidoreductase [Acidimicrobiales bacterium]HJO19747.1 SDR family oxidoreductase [Acidimicrobiales bacterium]|tara:strand:- start:9281 stop:10117 length:837 start_codon:yes stop_codon:yes gene_type:complete